MVQFTIAGNVAKIGLNITKRFRGQGYGLEIVRVSSKYILNKFRDIRKLEALIKKSNTVSIKTFTNAGYHKVKEKLDILYFEFLNN
jgi:RimJ/RimL family protein N-acetyltransferase